MPRKTTFEELVIMTSRIPWQFNLILAPLAYFILHWYAGRELYIIPGLDNLADNTMTMMLNGLAQVCQYFLPAIFVLGAIVSLWGRRKREGLYRKASKDINALSGMSWSDFELLTGEYFRNRGFRVEETREGADGGVDLVVYRNDLKFLVQCKHWKSASIGVKVVRELLGVVVATGAAGGYVICSGRFTKEATRFARENSIQLLGKQELSDILSGNTDPHNIQEASKVTPVCPECGKKMVRRVARKGSRIGQEFWGCSDFPKCRGIR